MQAYCDRQGFQMSTIRFMFDGNPLGPEATPSEVSAVHLYSTVGGYTLWEYSYYVVSPYKGRGGTVECSPSHTCERMLYCYCVSGDVITRSSPLQKLFVGDCPPPNILIYIEQDYIVTPQLEMEDDDTIEVFQQQTGGH